MNLGKKATDKITGFTGTITGYVTYITGCNQYLIVPGCKKGEEDKKPAGEWVDDSRVQIDDKAKRFAIERVESVGPDILPAAE